MLSKAFLIIILSVAALITNAQIEPEWVERDSLNLNAIIKLDKKNPKEVEAFFQQRRYGLPQDSLGFGWRKATKTVSGGYISFQAEFFYLHDSIQSYILKSWLPDDDSLFIRYLPYYRQIFDTIIDNALCYKFNEKNILRPLDQFADHGFRTKIRKQVLEYMSPESGLIYGFRGGVGGGVLENRWMFNKVRKKITRDELFAIMYSINPASRLTAIEYYQRNKKRFPGTKEIDSWIEIVFQECPKVESMSGCLRLSYNSKSLVKQYTSISNANYARMILY